MKKIISIILSLVCFAGVINIPLASEEQALSYKYIHMVDLGFMSSDEDPGYIVTRGEFAQIICKAANIQAATQWTNMYNDVEYGTEYFNSIMAVTEAGIMKGYGNGTFKPLEPVSVIEAAKVMVHIAGYSLIAETYGGYQNGYVEVANELNLFKNTSVGGYTTAVKRKDVGIMLFNLMNAPIDSVFSPSYGAFVHRDNAVTFAEKYHKLKYTTNIVKANSYTNFSATIGNISENQIVIGEKLLITQNYKDRFLVGRYVSAFYEEETDRIVSIAERTNDEKIKRLMSYEVEILDADSISYIENNRNKTINFDNQTIFVYNDEYVLSYDLTQLAGNNSYCIDIVSNEKSLGYEVVFIYDYYTVVSDGLSSDYLIKSKLLPVAMGEIQKTVNVDEDQIDVLVICDSEFNKMEPEDILNGDVLTVISNTSYNRVMVSRSNMKRQINGVRTDENGGRLISDDDEIRIVPELDGFLNENSLMGKDALIYTDIFGNAAYIVVESLGEEKCGILVEEPKFIDEYDEFDKKTVKFKIFTQDSEEVNLFSTEKIKVGDTTIKLKGFSSLPPELSGKAMLPVLYRMNDDGQIKQIVFPETNISGNKDGFFKGVSISAAYFSTSQKTFGDKMGEGGQTEAGPNTIAFMLKNGVYDDTARVVVGNAIYNGATDYELDAYYKSRNNDVADILIVKTDLQRANQNSFAAVITAAGAEELYNEEICRRFEYLQNGEIKTAYSNPSKYSSVDLSSINAGDTVLMEIDTQGYISGIRQLYNYASGTLTPYDSNNRWSYLVASVGYVVRNSNGRIRTSSVKETINDTSVFSKPIHVLSSYSLVLVESKDKITKCTAEDIKLGDKVVFVTRAGAGRVIVVYK